MFTAKRYRIIALSLSAVLLGTWWYSTGNKDQAKPLVANINSEPTQQANTRQTQAPSQSEASPELNAEQTQLSELATAMRLQFGDRLTHPMGKLEMVADLRNWFMANYPNDWREMLAAFLQREFPDMAEKLVAMLDAIIEYEDFGQSLDLSQFTSSEDLNQYMWDKRLQLFGEDAEEIWADEIKKQQMQKAVVALGEVAGNFAELQQQYIDTRIEIFGDTIFADQSSHLPDMLNEFLQLDNVQSELTDMSSRDRKTALRSLRTNLGMDEAALTRWEALDERRETAWSLGAEYMSRRSQLESQFAGDELIHQIYELQEELFSEALVVHIRNEESTGFFRYSRKQTIGLN